jgi:glycosyltransferase involved in cell wall biosynthesis
VKSLRVLHINEATTAGVGRHLYDLSCEMQKAGLDVTVACPRAREGASDDVSFVDRLVSAGLSVAIVPMRRRIHLRSDIRSLHALIKLIREGRFDVVHAHSSKAGVLGRLAAWTGALRGERPVTVYTPNAFAFSGARTAWARWLYRAIERCLGHYATDALICVSPSELAQAQEYAIVASQRMVLIENAIDFSQYASGGDPAAAKARLGLDPASLAVGFVGRLARQKGVTCLVEAARLVLEAGVECQFLLVGEGELEDVVREMVQRADLDGRVLLAGFQSEIAEVLGALDVFVLPSLYEGLSYSLMEAMAAGRPVVATRVAGNCDLVRDRENGLLIPPGDAMALSEALIELICAPAERTRLGCGAAETARRWATPAEMSGRVIELYVKLSENRGVGANDGSQA